MASNLTKVMGLWAKSKDGKTMLSGRKDAFKIIILPNTFKKHDKEPDYNLFISPACESPETEQTTPAPIH